VAKQDQGAYFNAERLRVFETKKKKFSEETYFWILFMNEWMPQDTPYFQLSLHRAYHSDSSCPQALGPSRRKWEKWAQDMEVVAIEWTARAAVVNI